MCTGRFRCARLVQIESTRKKNTFVILTRHWISTCYRQQKIKPLHSTNMTFNANATDTEYSFAKLQQTNEKKKNEISFPETIESSRWHYFPSSNDYLERKTHVRAITSTDRYILLPMTLQRLTIIRLSRTLSHSIMIISCCWFTTMARSYTTKSWYIQIVHLPYIEKW